MNEKEPTGAWNLSFAYNILTEEQKQEYDFRRNNFNVIESPEHSLDYVRKWIK